MRFPPAHHCLRPVVCAAALALLVVASPLRAQQDAMPDSAPPPAVAPAANPSAGELRLVTEAFAALQGRIDALTAQVSEMRAEQQRSRLETIELRKQVELLRSQLSPELRTANYSARAQQQAPGPLLPDSQKPSAAAEVAQPQDVSERLSQIEETQQLTDAKLSDSVVTGPPFRAKKNVRARLVLLFTTDLVDHYSQMANYMRAMGMIPPSSYPPPKS